MTIQKLYLILFLFSITQPTNAQPGFSLLKDVGLINNHYRDMVIDNDTIVCYGLAANDTTTNWQQGLLISKFDSSGNHLMSNFILDSLGDHLAIGKDWGMINTTTDGGYILTAAPVNRRAGIFIKLSHNLQLEFIREYSDTINRSQFYYEKPLELSDGFLMFGWIQRANYLRDGFIRKVDEQGHTIWFNYYGNFDIEELFTDLYPVNDSIWVVAGVAVYEEEIRSFLKLIDLQGNVVNTWQSGFNPEIGLLRKVFPTEDKGFITYGIRLVEEIGSTYIVQSTLAKLDSTFQIEWVQPFGRAASSGAEELWDIKPTSDGHYIGVGESVVKYLDSPSLRGGWLYKFSVEGDSIWGRRDPPPLLVISGNKGFFAGVGELSSGNIIAVGGAQEGAVFSGWLVKVTPDGCLDTLCNLSTAIEEYIMLQGNPSLYPNPSDGLFTVELPQEYLGKKAMFTIFDTQGQQIWREERKIGSKMEFNMSVLSHGLYFLHIEMESIRWVEKVFVY